MTKDDENGLDRRSLLTSPLALGLAAAFTVAGVTSAHAAPTAKPLPGSNIRRGYADGPFGQIHFRDGGGDGLPLIMFHQSPMSSQQFTACYPYFRAKGIRAIGVDMPGFGGSDVTEGQPKVEDWAKVYPAVLDHLKIKKADVFGHHTGATVATECALAYPDRVRKLAIHGALLVTEEERKVRLQRVMEGEAKGAAYAADGSHLSDRYKGVMRRYLAGAKPEDVDPLVITRFVTEEFSNPGPNWYGHYAAYAYDHGAALKKVKHPAMLISNTGDNVFELTMRLKQLRPDFTFVVIEGGAIDVCDQVPDAWTTGIANFMKA